MAFASDLNNPSSKNKPSAVQSYPTPLSPPLPSISEEIELARAMAASSRSSLFNLSRGDILYEDQWLIAVNKPQGVYCETVLESVPRILADSARSTDFTEAVEEKLVKDDGEKDEILVRAYPWSGWTHKIRLHCQYLGISIRGDVKYEGVYGWKGKEFDGHKLHAEILSFEHPVIGLTVAFSAALSPWATWALHPL